MRCLHQRQYLVFDAQDASSRPLDSRLHGLTEFNAGINEVVVDFSMPIRSLETQRTPFWRIIDL